MKAILAVLMFVSVNSYAATREIVPRATNEGAIGTSALIWNAGYFKDATVTFGVSAATVAVSGESLFNGTANHVSTITNRGVISADQLNAIFGVNVATGAFSGAVAITGQATFDGTANHVSTISNRGVISADQVSLVFGISAATAAITGAVNIGGVKMSSFTADGFLDVPADIKAAYLNITSTANVTGVLTSSGTINTGYSRLGSKTLAELNAYIPAAAGESWFCSNCLNEGICVTSGTTRGAVVDISSPIAHCDTVNP